jgi:hypothetical protein
MNMTGPHNAVLFLFFIAFTQIALLNIITGLFIESALKYAAPDASMIAMNLRKESVEMVEQLEQLWCKLEVEDDCNMQERHFKQRLEDESIRLSFEMLGLDVEDSGAFFHLLDELHGSVDGELSKEEFIYGCIKLRGNSTSRHMQTLGLRIRSNQKHLLTVLTEIQARMEGRSEEDDMLI